jgi:predicted anti-sigma-YlaC factor YlaD
MVQPSFDACDVTLLDRFLNADLSLEKEDALMEHLKGCPRCRQYIDTLREVARDFENLVADAANQVDFTRLEKEVLTSVIHHPQSTKKASAVSVTVKFLFTIFLIVGVLALLAYLYIHGFFGH